MGLANGLDYAVQAARVLQQRGNHTIAIVLHGGGGKRAELERQVRDYALDNVVFSDLVPDKTVVAQLVAGCNVCLTIYRAAKEHTWSPNKMFDGLAAGKPVLVNVPGWLAETVEKNGCGRGLDPERPEELADALEELAADPQLCKDMGRNARALAEREFARPKLAARLEQVLLRTVEGH
jgi:glycosyltransferase involved in cell wall biosynthesis